MNDHQENLLDHYVNPRNFGTPAFDSNASAKLLNTSCGDELTVFLKINDGIVDDISFIGEGCSIAIGSASQLYETLIGKDIRSILQKSESTPEDLIGIPLTVSRKKCASLSLEAVKQAIQQYNKDNR